MSAEEERAKLFSLCGDLPPRDYLVFSRLIDKLSHRPWKRRRCAKKSWLFSGNGSKLEAVAHAGYWRLERSD
ncbi:MAG TPA: hypothetical protein GXZ98_09885 [Firmicutes bacterium]|nr:hypothetical protein [Bacillota bacterium]